MSASTPYSRNLQDTKKGGFPQLEFDTSTSSAKTIAFVLGSTGAGSATAPTSAEELVARFRCIAKPTALVLRPRGASNPTHAASREHLSDSRCGHPPQRRLRLPEAGQHKDASNQGVPTGTEVYAAKLRKKNPAKGRGFEN